MILQIFTLILLQVKMCSHEYDVIRFKAISSTQALSRFYGWSRWSEDILHPMIVSLAQTGTSFYSASGALAILRSGHVVEKVAARWDLAELLLKSVLCSGPMVAAIIDNDKKGMFYFNYRTLNSHLLLHLLIDIMIIYREVADCIQ